MNRLERILLEKKKQGKKWNEFAKDLNITGEALRIAFKRESVDDVYLKHIESILFPTDKPTEQTEESGRFEDIIAQKVRELNKEEFEAINKKLDNLKTQNRDINELLIGLASVYEEILNRVSDIQKSVKN